jgi:Transposase DDE domain
MSITLERMRAFMASEGARELYKQRADIEGTLSQGIRTMGLRQTRYRGMQTVPVKYSAGLLPEGCEPLLLMSMFCVPFFVFSTAQTFII